MSLEATFVFHDVSIDNLPGKIRFFKGICDNFNGSCSFAYDGVEIYIDSKLSVEEILISYFSQKEFLNKIEQDKLKIYIAALIMGAPYDYREDPNIGKATKNAENIFGKVHCDRLFCEAIKKMAAGELNPVELTPGELNS